eukprot:TRINITY_DN80817_c0_g1_i1.p1 TRINITY_DN80817_c0_g1~~TRINITY_DN80817_c0_g1_i1.p1  ORF type:complete len:346 (-),score=35.87 TRINITY_DN80817_c0_g1_i1:158-1195(-)
MSSCRFAYLVAVIAACVSGIEDNSPWIGILGLPAAVECDSLAASIYRKQFSSSASCFTNVYDKWVQAAGARAVGIPYDALDANVTALHELLRSLNGIVFTGGGLDLADTSSPYYRTGKYIFDWVKHTNDQGIYYPLTGHCMGFQYLAILASGDNSSVLLRNSFDSEDLSLALSWTPAANASSWLRRMPGSIKKTFSEEPSTTNLHHDGVTTASFFGSPQLSSFFDIISTNKDRKGKEFISTMEAKKYPILAVQWHPERNQFEWSSELGINHSMEVVIANAWTAFDFVRQARCNQPKDRNWALLRRFSTYTMQVVADGDPLSGITFLLYDGFIQGAEGAQMVSISV